MTPSRMLQGTVAAAVLGMMPLQAMALSATLSSPSASSLPAVHDSFLAAAQAQEVEQTISGPELLQSRAATYREQQAAENPARDRFEARYPDQAAARQYANQPDTQRWALLIGINEHLGRVHDNYGSRQDAEDLRLHLLAQGWRDDHILVISDRDATRETMVQGMYWLARKSTNTSTAIFHYSGHSKKWYGQDHDGDGEVTDEGLWPTDDQFIPDSEVVARLGGVRAREFWINISACNSAGFNDPGLERDGRLLTFSSREDQKSYEDPSVDNSVWGYYLFDQALLAGLGDLNGDGKVTVEEAFVWARPRAHDRTVGQRYGTQDAVAFDGVPGDFSLQIPPPPPPPEEPEQERGVLCNLLCLGNRED